MTWWFERAAIDLRGAAAAGRTSAMATRVSRANNCLFYITFVYWSREYVCTCATGCVPGIRVSGVRVSGVRVSGIRVSGE